MPCGAPPYDPRRAASSLQLRRSAARALRPDAARVVATSDPSLAARANMWRYRELMPLLDGEEPVTLGEGWTPLIHARRLGAGARPRRAFRQGRVAQSDELLQGARPVGGGHARAAPRRHGAVRSRPPATPATRWPPTPRLPGFEAHVFMPRDVKTPFIRECELYGAEVTLVDGLITDAGRIAAELGKPLGWYDVSTLKEPYRIEGKKTMGYELAEQLDWKLPDWIIYPTGGGTGMVGMWKAFDEMRRSAGCQTGGGRSMVTVQADRLRADHPRVRAGRRASEMWENAHTVADGLRVPKAIGDFLVLRAVRESGGAAVAVGDADMVTGMRDLGALEGISAAPEGGAALHAVACSWQRPHQAA